MATYVQRAQSIADALLNAVATPAQVNRLGVAIAKQTDQLEAYSAGTNAVKAQILVTGVRNYLLSIVKATEGASAADSARTTAETTVGTDFAETP